MEKITLQELYSLFKVSAWFVGIIGAIITIAFSMLAYFYKSDRENNREDHRELYNKVSTIGREVAKLQGGMKK